MIQLAWRFLRFQKESALARWYRARTADSRIGTRKTMIVALARKLVIALWRFVTAGETLEGVILRPAGCTPGRAFPYLLGARVGFQPTAELTIRGGGTPYSNMALMPTERMGPPPGASPPMRMTASWSGSNDPTVYKSVATKMCPTGELPSDPQQTDRSPSRRRAVQKAPVAVH